MNHRIISLLMAMLMTVSLLPTAVWAQGETLDQTAVPVMDDGAAERESATPEAPAEPEVPAEPEADTQPEADAQLNDVSLYSSSIIKNGQCGDNVYWSLDNGTLRLYCQGSGTGTMWDYDYDYTSNCVTNPWWSIDWYSSRISHIVVESGVTYIGEYAFCCNRAESFSIASSVEEIGSYSFSGCRGATSITLPDGLQRIDACAFRGFGDEVLQTINIPDSVIYIGEAAFLQSEALTSINFSGTMDQWIDCGGGMSFFSRNVTLTCQGGGDLSRSGGKCGDNLMWTLDSSGKLTISGTGEMYDYYYDDNYTPTVPWAKLRSMIRSIEIGSGVSYIGAWAFENTNIDTLSIPGSVKVIGHGAFYRNIYLSSVLLTNGTEVIAREAFSTCNQLSSISIPDTVTEIGRRAFYGCYNMYSLNGIHETGLTSITIPGSVTSIGTDAFANCNLLKTVSFGGTQTQWNAIGGGNAGVPSDASIYYITPGVITSGGTAPQATDIQALYEYLTGQDGTPYTQRQEKAADVNQDGMIDVYDLQYLYELVSGIQTA